MITVHFIGRVGKDAQVIDGSKGQFVTMDVADEYFNKGENVTRWTRIKSSDPNIVKMAKYFTKGKPLEIHGELMKDDEWDTSNGEKRWQHVVRAKTITFVPGGKKKDDQNGGGQQSTDSLPTPPPAVVENTDPFPAPDDKDGDDLPF